MDAAPTIGYRLDGLLDLANVGPVRNSFSANTLFSVFDHGYCKHPQTVGSLPEGFLLSGIRTLGSWFGSELICVPAVAAPAFPMWIPIACNSNGSGDQDGADAVLIITARPLRRAGP